MTHRGVVRIRCRLCGSEAELVFRGYPGYQAPNRYDIYSCPQCESSFAEPSAVNEALYEYIYRHRWSLPGYNWYALQAIKVRKAKDPLAYLREANYVYRGVIDCLERLGSKADLRILELGSGLGYLTYALHAAGYNIHGVDVSAKAVSRARRRFGDLYDCGSLEDLCAGKAGQYDVLLALELIEHIPDVVQFLSSAVTLVSKAGALIVTTPNRDAYDRSAVWRTEAPPVHLWWFSMKSLEVLASLAGLALARITLSGYGNAIFAPANPATQGVLLEALPRLSERGRVCYPNHRTLGARFLIAHYLEKLHLLSHIRHVRNLLSRQGQRLSTFSPPTVSNETAHLCVVFHG